jgi:tetratricopeptide (TPR) repeat protein
MPTNASDKSDEVERALARYQAVDGLLLRPKLGSIDAALDIGAGTAGPRIALLAHQELEQLLRNSPADPLPYLQLAKIYQSQHRWKDTLRVLDAGVQHNPDYEPLILLREDLVLQAAEQAVDDARDRNTRDPSKETQLALERCETNLANERVQFCQKRFKRHPDQRELLVIWAGALKDLSRAEEAIPLLEQAAQYPPLRARAFYDLGLCQQQLSRPIEALSGYRKAAFFRAPPPDPRLRVQALMQAFELSDRLGMVDAAIRYAELLVLAQTPQAAQLAKRIEVLKQTPF